MDSETINTLLEQIRKRMESGDWRCMIGSSETSDGIRCSCYTIEIAAEGKTPFKDGISVKTIPVKPMSKEELDRRIAEWDETHLEKAIAFYEEAMQRYKDKPKFTELCRHASEQYARLKALVK
jgi:hypothetical protein